MGKYIVYQGYNEQFRWREVDADGVSVRDENDVVVQSDLLPTQQTAVDAVKALDVDAEIELRPTIAEVAEQNAKKETE